MPDNGKVDRTAKKLFCEFFAGIGLIREALVRSGWSCVYANDNDPKKKEMYESHFGNSDEFHFEDVWETKRIVNKIQGSPFLATASFPCIDLSLAGHWRGFEGKHSSTFFAFAKAMRGLGRRKPKVILLENVAGFLTSNNGEDFRAAVRALADLGYWIDAFVLDARYFVPQSRVRVFVLGVQRSLALRQLATSSGSNYLDDPWRRVINSCEVTRPKKLRGLMESTDLATGWAAASICVPQISIASLNNIIDVDAKQDWWDEEAVQKHYKMMSPSHKRQVDDFLEKKGTRVGTIFRRKRNGSTKAETRFDGVAGCLRTPRGGSAKQIIIVIRNQRLMMRWMSPIEYARLQGAGNYKMTGSRNQQLLGFGDAVCVPVVQWIDEKILTPLYEASIKKNVRQSHARATKQNNGGLKNVTIQ